MTQLYVVRDVSGDRPGAYLLVYKLPVPHPTYPGISLGEREHVLTWRRARTHLTDDQYTDVCRSKLRRLVLAQRVPAGNRMIRCAHPVRRGTG